MIKLFEKFNDPEIEEKFWDNGQKRYEIWSLNGKEHREDGPSCQYWNSNGQKASEKWSLNGNFHREDGPAYQWWSFNGRKSEWWHLNDIRYTREEWVEELKRIGSPHYEEQQMLLDMEKYNL